VEAEGTSGQESSTEPIGVREACEAFLRDAEARNLRGTTLYKYRLLFRQFQEVAQQLGLRYLRELDGALLRQFRAQWPNRNLSALKKLECLRAFFRFAHQSGWIPENVARHIKNPKIEDQPTLPFTQEEMIRILRPASATATAMARREEQMLKDYAPLCFFYATAECA